MYVVKLMRSGYSLRVSIPRDVQRHLGVKRGDILLLELREGGAVEVHKINEEVLRRARVTSPPARPD